MKIDAFLLAQGKPHLLGGATASQARAPFLSDLAAKVRPTAGVGTADLFVRDFQAHRLASLISTFKRLMVGLAGTSALLFSPGAAHAQLAPPKLYTLSPTGVDLATGNYTTSSTDISVGGLSLERSYLTFDQPGKGVSTEYFGPGWTHNFDIFARQRYIAGQASSEVIIGRTTYRFAGWPQPTTYPDNDEIGTSLTTVNGSMVFMDRDGTVYNFLPGTVANISNIRYPDGTIITFNYASNLLKMVATTKGWAIVFDYSGGVVGMACAYNLANSYVTTSTSCAAAPIKVSYGYAASKLTSITDALGNVASNTCDSLGLLSCPTDSGTTTCKYTITNTINTHTALANVTRQVAADGATWSFDCSCGSAALADPSDPFAEEYSTTTEPNGSTSSINFVQGSPSYYKNENGKVYTPSYVGRLPLSHILPEGNKVTWSYNARNVQSGISFYAKTGSGLATISQDVETFPADCTNPVTCNEPLTVTDANSNVTNFTYDQAHGGVLTEVDPADASGLQRVKRYQYAQRYAWVSNGAGGYVHATSPIWVRTGYKTCRTSATSTPVSYTSTCAAGSVDEVTTTYDYGPDTGTIGNNLLLRGEAVSSGSITLRTCYGYDALGHRISETKPNAGLLSCY